MYGKPSSLKSHPRIDIHPSLRRHLQHSIEARPSVSANHHLHHTTHIYIDATLPRPPSEHILHSSEPSVKSDSGPSNKNHTPAYLEKKRGNRPTRHLAERALARSLTELGEQAINTNRREGASPAHRRMALPAASLWSCRCCTPLLPLQLLLLLLYTAPRKNACN